MARYRLSEPAKADITGILRRSKEVHGAQARIRYRACLSAAMRRVADDPQGPSTVNRADLDPGIRSFHIRHSRAESREMPVVNPVHVLFYRVKGSSIVEIVRVLHERMEPRLHVGSEEDANQKQTE